jgi:hypothetical protein
MDGEPIELWQVLQCGVCSCAKFYLINENEVVCSDCNTPVEGYEVIDTGEVVLGNIDD